MSQIDEDHALFLYENCPTDSLNSIKKTTSYFIDIIYNHIYKEGLNLKSEGHAKSITDGYKECLVRFAKSLDDNVYFKDHINLIHKRNNVGSLSSVSFQEKVDSIGRAFAPEDFYDVMDKDKKITLLIDVLKKSIKRFLPFVLKHHIVGIIENHKDVENANIMQTKLMYIFLLQREEVFNTFHTNQIKPPSNHQNINAGAVLQKLKHANTEISDLRVQIMKKEDFINKLKQIIIKNNSEKNLLLTESSDLKNQIIRLKNEVYSLGLELANLKVALKQEQDLNKVHQTQTQQNHQTLQNQQTQTKTQTQQISQTLPNQQNTQNTQKQQSSQTSQNQMFNQLKANYTNSKPSYEYKNYKETERDGESEKDEESEKDDESEKNSIIETNSKNDDDETNSKNDDDDELDDYMNLISSANTLTQYSKEQEKKSDTESVKSDDSEKSEEFENKELFSQKQSTISNTLDDDDLIDFDDIPTRDYSFKKEKDERDTIKKPEPEKVEVPKISQDTSEKEDEAPIKSKPLPKVKKIKSEVKKPRGRPFKPKQPKTNRDILNSNDDIETAFENYE